MKVKKAQEYTLQRYNPEELREMSRCKDVVSNKNLWDLIEKNPLHETLLAIGDSFQYIVDYQTFSIPFISKSAEGITGYSLDHWKQDGFEHNFRVMHPEDGKRLKYINLSHFEHNEKIPLNEKPKYRYTFDFRIKHQDGSYIRLLHHSVFLLFDEFGKPVFQYNICMNITDFKKTEEINCSIAKFDSNTERYINEQSMTFPATNNFNLTPRQIEIVNLIANGCSNKDIAETLSLTEHTVKDHRKKMLAQNNLHSMAALIKKAVVSGMI